MSKRLTTEEFVRKAREAHGDKYNYSKVNYVDSDTKVCIICPKHGEFWQIPENHARGQNCPKCSKEHRRIGVYGQGIYDKHEESERKLSEWKWRGMIRRAADKSFKEEQPTYRYVTVCDDWKEYSNFKKWFDEHYVEGWELDKDILIKGNREYSPDKCCFVPNIINMFFARLKRKQSKCPLGVYRTKGGKYQAKLNEYGKPIYLGTFDLPEDAFSAYKREKERYLKELANKYKDKLEPRVYETLYEWELEITD